MIREKQDIQIETTADGSNTLFIPQLDEHYHSVKGALTESEHIFIRMGLEHLPLSSVRLLEIGFGTGLNAFLTLLAAERLNKSVHYTGIELYPLEESTLKQLDYPEVICPERANDYYELHSCKWEQDNQITNNFTLHKIKGDFTTYLFSGNYDLIYFDAFAPEKQAEMWTQELFNSLYVIMNKGGILTTYCAKGVVRRMLQSAGFTVERLPGPPQGKREILRATK